MFRRRKVVLGVSKKNPADYTAQPEEQVETRTRPSYNRRSYAGVTPQRIPGEFADPLDRFAKYRRRSANIETLRKEANDITETPVRDQDFKYSRRKFRSEEDLLSDTKDTTPTASCSTLHVQHLDLNEGASRKLKSEEKLNTSEPGTSILINTEKESDSEDSEFILKPKEAEYSKPVLKEQITIANTCQDSEERKETDSTNEKSTPEIKEFVLSHPGQTPEKISTAQSQGEGNKPKQQPIPAPRTSLILQSNQSDIHQDQKQSITKETESEVVPVKIPVEEAPKPKPVSTEQQWKNNNKPTSPPSQGSDKEASKSNSISSSDSSKHQSHLASAEPRKAPVKPDRPKRKAKLQKLQQDSLGTTTLGSTSSSPGSTSPSLSPSPSPLFLDSSSSDPMKTSHEEKEPKGQSTEASVTSKPTTYLHIVSPPKFTSPGSASQAISWKSVGYLPQTSPTRDFPPPLAPNSTDTNAKSCQEDEIIPQVAKSRVEHPVDIEKEVTNIELNPVTSEEEQDMENKKACRDELANLRAQFFADMDSVADQSFDFVPTLVTATGGARVRSSGSVSEDEIQPVSIKRKVSPTGQKEEEEDKLGVEEHRILPVMQEHDASLPNLHDMEEGVEEDQIQSEVAQRRDISHMEQVGDIVLLPVEHVVLNEAAPSHGQNGLTEPQELQGYSLDGSIDDVKEDFPVARSHSPVSIEEEPISPIALVKKDPTIFIDNTLNFIVNDSGNDHSDRSVAVVEENKQAGIEMLAELVADDAYDRAVIQNGGIHSSNGKDDITEDDGVKEDHIIKEIKSELKPDINFPVETGIPVSDGSEIEQDETEDGTAVHISREYFPENQCKSVPDLTELDDPEEICEKTLPESQDFQQSQQKSSEYFPENQCKSVPDLTALDQTNVVLTSTGDVISGRDEVEPAMADEYFPENQCKSVPDLTALDQTNVVLTSTGDVISGRDEVEPAIADEYFPENQCKSVPDLTELDSPPVKKITDTPEYFPENQCKSIPDFQAMDSSQQQTSGDNQGTDVPKATGREEYFPENQCKSIPDLVGLGEMTQGNNKPGINIQDPGQKPDEVVSPLSPVQPAKFTLGGDDDSPTIIPPVISFGTTQSKTTSTPPKPPRNTKAIDKAMEIAREVEPSHVFHKEEVEVTSGENELEKERKQLISQMKVRRKKVATWKGVPESPPMPATSGKPLNSMKRYEERKKQIQKQQPDVIPKTKAQGEVESHSIRDQDLTKKHWEEKLAEEEEKKSFRKQHKHKNHEGEHDNRLKEESFISEDGLKYRDEMIQDEKNIKSLDTDNDKYASESAIDREIRLATEREERLRKEREDRLLELHLKPTPHSVQSKQPPAKQQTTSAKSPTNAGGDSWSSKPMSSAESSVVQDQHEERHIMKRQGLSQPVPGYEKEQQQSEFERQEKEEERLSAHESIVEREIRLQREREEIIARERERAYQQKIEESKKKTSPPTSSAPHKEKSQAASGGSLKLHISSPVASTTKPAVKTSSAPSGETMAEGKHFAHPGESRIARELREQREREEEIQRLRRQMSGSQGKASDCGDQDEADTKSVDVPQQPSGTWQKEVKPFKREGYSFSANSTDSAHSTGTNTSYSALHASSVQNDTVTSPRSPKVKPFQDVEPQNSYKYVPQPETPIERDIRIAREREEELRKTHTSPKLPLPAEREVVIIEKEVPQKTPDHSDGHNGVTLRTKPKGNSTNTQEKFTFRKSQNLTESKIHQELEEMQQREQELKSRWNQCSEPM
ncbi:uncharacterized protein LOC106155523 [Lingula anatina]|uniref:Uncharacterized protein LOC106155523 n=1 Tax=Lingula anatina TaxID=7574 RepID=A0A2R2MLH0_LINAN|nr:uncharacterized protein LOC106155523 [Lingula anatina]|eukprot:XP_023931049.1 uncharacterized protein LOC106155523 [Lingula anatina]